MKYNFTEVEVRSAAERASSKTEMMRLLKIKQGGGGYQALDFWCRKYDVKPPQFVANTDAARFKNTLSDEEWFVDGVRRSGQASRARLVRRGIPDLCSECGQEPFWNGKPLTLQLDHINGNRWDNRIENLRILCPHCHTQTETYANNGAVRRRYYCECGKEIAKTTKQCRKCDAAARVGVYQFDWPAIEDIVEGIRLTNFSRYAKMIGVSDNAIRKHLERNGVDWRKI